MNAQRPGADSPPHSDESGGSKEKREPFITRREGGLVVVAVVLAFGVAAYLNDRLMNIQAAVHANAQGLAVVQTEIKGLRRDIERVEGEVNPGPIKRPAGHIRYSGNKNDRPPI